MISESKITSAHRSRLALVYVRQSTLAQVRFNTESTARQYALADHAVALGWERDRVLVLDGDLGRSGASAAAREDFKELVSRVCLGEVGAVFGLEISRLARSSADLQRLLEFCNLTATLVVDADGIYDLHNFNDRLLLGLKGTMSEAELHILAGRLQESKRAAAARGALPLPLPIGYVHGESGETVLDPNEEVRAAVADAFAAFAAGGSAYAVVRAFAGRPFPQRAYGGPWGGEVRWEALTHARILDLLANPSYAGAYVYGRNRVQRSIDAGGTIRTRSVRIPRAEWSVLIQDHHPAYISWQTHLDIGARLAANCSRRGARPPREGSALLQGLVRCGSCGHPMSTSYPANRPTYQCVISRADHVRTPGCRSVAAARIDATISRRLLEAVSADQIALALAAAEEVTARRTRATRALERQLERTRYEADRAARAFHACEPENRLVARSLEARWEATLGAVAEAEAAVAASRAELALPARAELEMLATDLPRLWQAPSTSDRDRKRLLRALIADVTLISDADGIGDRVRIGIHWRSGATEELVVNRPGRSHSGTSAEVVERVRQLCGQTDRQIAAELTAAGLRTGRGQSFDVRAVRHVRRGHGIPSTYADAAPGELSIPQLAARLAVPGSVIYRWARSDRLPTRRTASGQYRIAFTADVERVCRGLITDRARIESPMQDTVIGGAV